MSPVIMIVNVCVSVQFEYSYIFQNGMLNFLWHPVEQYSGSKSMTKQASRGGVLPLLGVVSMP